VSLNRGDFRPRDLRWDGLNLRLGRGPHVAAQLRSSLNRWRDLRTRELYCLRADSSRESEIRQGAGGR
jgi:hypothetical protein